MGQVTVVNRPGKWVDLCQGLKMPDNPEVWKAVAMQDHFEKIQKLPDKVEGVPNFRRVPGYKVFCCGQPTKEGFVKAIEKACGDKWPKDGPIVWLNMRQEAIVYINGNPVCARPPGKIGEYAELGNVTRSMLLVDGASVKADEEEFVKVLKKRAEDSDGKVKVTDVGKKESEIKVEEVMSLHDVIEGVKEKFPGLTHNRIPVCNSAAPLEPDFDTYAVLFWVQMSIAQLLSTARSVYLDPPPDVCALVSSVNSNFLLLTKASLKLSLV